MLTPRLNCFTCLLVATTLANAALAQPYDPAPKQLRIMTWNVEWMFDDDTSDNRSGVAKEQSAPSRKFWDTKLAGVAKVIADADAHIVALQEIEGRKTLADIAGSIQSQYGLSFRYAFIEGMDSYLEQDVGFLVRDGLVSFRRQEQSREMFNSGDFYNISKHLIAEFRWSNVPNPLTMMNVHFRARAEAEKERVRQAKLARLWLDEPLRDGHDVILLGDLNSEHAAGTVAGDAAEIAGPAGPLSMVDTLSLLPDPKAATHLILDKQFDRIFVSRSLMQDGAGQDWSFERIEILDKAIIRGKKDGPEHWDERLTMSLEELDLSDHFPVVATFRLQ